MSESLKSESLIKCFKVVSSRKLNRVRLGFLFLGQLLPMPLLSISDHTYIVRSFARQRVKLLHADN